MEKYWKTAYPAFLAMLLLALAGRADPGATEGWEEEIKAESGQYLVKVQPRTVEVSRVENGPGAPPHMRVRILRKKNRPLELRLHTINKPDQPVRYTGGLERGNGSFVGLELEVSFDRKTWKRLGERIKRALP